MSTGDEICVTCGSHWNNVTGCDCTQAKLAELQIQTKRPNPITPPPPDAQAMTLATIEEAIQRAELCASVEWPGDFARKILFLAEQTFQPASDDAWRLRGMTIRAQAETIRQQAQEINRLEVELKKWQDSFVGHVYVKNEEWSAKCEEVRSLQARLTASEAAKKWTTARPTVKGQYWWRGSTDDKYPEVIPVFLVQGKSELHAQWGSYIALAEGGEWQGPLTPGEE